MAQCRFVRRRRDLPFYHGRASDVVYLGRDITTMNSHDGNARSSAAVFLLSAKGIISAFSTKRDARRSMARGDLLFDSLTDPQQRLSERATVRKTDDCRTAP